MSTTNSAPLFPLLGSKEYHGVIFVKAEYGYMDGEEKHAKDVSVYVQPHFKNGGEFKVENKNLGGDPYKGKKKTLWLHYTRPGQGDFYLTINEHETLKFDFSREVMEAYYGYHNYAYDVAKLVQLAFDIFGCYEASNKMLEKYYKIHRGQALPGGIPADPMAGKHKYLVIMCVGSKIFMGKEDDKVTTKLVAEEKVKDEL